MSTLIKSTMIGLAMTKYTYIQTSLCQRSKGQIISL